MRRSPTLKPLENLGDYSIVVEELHNFGGDAAELYKSKADMAVAQNTPRLLIRGGLIGGVAVLVIGLSTQVVTKVVRYTKERKKLLDKQVQLEQ